MKCLYCGEPLERIYYCLVGMSGKYCRICAHKIYSETGISFSLVDSDDE